MKEAPERTREVVELTEKMVKHRSTESREDELESCRELIRDYFRETDLSVKEHESNGKKSLVVLNKKNHNPEIMLHGHFDVVDGEEELFEPRLEEDRLYGRGTADMKAGLACMMRVMKEVEDAEASVMLAATPDEEVGGIDGTKYLVEEHYTPSFGISSEPNNVEGTYMDIIAKQKGYITFTISQKEPMFHGTKPWKGTDAADSLVKKYVSVTEDFADPDEREWSTTSFLKDMESRMSDENPNQAQMEFSVYPAGDYTLEEVKEKVRSLEDVDVEIGFEQSVLDTDYDNFYVQKLLDAAKNSLEKEEPEVTWKAPPSDMGHLYSQGIPAVVFGPEGYNSHRKDEHTVISSFEEYMNALENFVKKIG